MHAHRTTRNRVWTLAVAMLLALGAAASASAAAPAWRIDSLANTTALPSGTLTYYLQVVNVGSADADGSTITTTITLPPGVTGVSASGFEPGTSNLDCTDGNGDPDVTGDSTIMCETTNQVPIAAHSAPGKLLEYTIVTNVDPGITVPSTLTAQIDVSGGGAPDASSVDPTRIDSPPGFGLDAFDGQIASDASGDPFTQAGGHPYAASVAIDFNTVNNPLPLIGDLWPVEAVKDTLVNLPPGLVGSTKDLDQCTATQLANGPGLVAQPLCPATSQIGTTLVRLNGAGTFPNVLGPIAVFNMAPPPGVPAKFGFNVLGVLVTLTARLRSNGDYGLSIDGNDLPEGLPIAGTMFTFWGVPSDPSHDSERSCPGQVSPGEGGLTCPSGAQPRAFLRNPTSCTAPASSPVQDGLATTLSIDSWAHPGARDANGGPATGDPSWQTGTWVTHDAPGYPHPPSEYGAHLLPTGCDKVPFTPAFDLRPATPTVRASTPTPFTVDLSLPQSDDPTTIGQSDLKKSVVTLPAGVRISPSSANGLGACTPAQIGLHSTADAQCPDSSKVATMTITTPLIDQELTGSVYLATPHDNPFDSLVAIYLVAKGPGVVVKLAGDVQMDPSTGQITTTVESPQLPFSDLHLEFFGGPRAPLMTPAACGTYTTHATLTPWSRPDAPVGVDSSFTVDANSDGSACSPPGFSPGFKAGTLDPTAGKFTLFLMRLTRGDGDQELNSLSVDMPTGALAKIASVTQCPDGEANAGNCQDVSKIGNVTVGAGAGPNPFYIQNGRAYLTGPYKGAPFGLSIVVPAVAGPFDLGNVVVRAKLDVDRHTAQAHVVSDPLPTILQGIPLDVRDIRVTIDRPNFFVNPTSCASKNVLATVGSTLGAIAHVSTHFQMTNCAALPLAPKLSLTVGAKRHTQAGVSTPVTATLTQTPDQSNLRSVSVALPGTLNALLPVVNRACDRSAFDAGRCGKQSKIGTAVAVTPLLRDPLRGSAYFVKTSPGHLPNLMVALRGAVSLDLTGIVKIPGGKRLATLFNTIPDAPITKFSLRIVSGTNGPVGIATNLCSAKGRAATAAIGYRGQNGAIVTTNQRLHINSCPRAAKARRGKR
jgi:hypothetical protein